MGLWENVVFSICTKVPRSALQKKCGRKFNFSPYLLPPSDRSRMKCVYRFLMKEDDSGFCVREFRHKEISTDKQCVPCVGNVCLVLIRVIGAVFCSFRRFVFLESVLAYFHRCLFHGEFEELVVVFIENRIKECRIML